MSNPQTHVQPKNWSLFSRLRVLTFGFDVFISYSHIDKVYAESLEEKLTQFDLACFRDEHEMVVGDRLISAIEKAIKKTQVLVVIGTENSYSSSYVQKEIQIFSEINRKIIIIDFDTIWQPKLDELSTIGEPILIPQKKEAIHQIPVLEVLSKINDSISFTRRNVLTRRAVLLTLFLLLGLTVGIGLQTNRAFEQMENARANALVLAVSRSDDPGEAAQILLELKDNDEPLNGVRIAHDLIQRKIPTQQIKLHDNWTHQVLFNKNGTRIYTASDDATVAITTLKPLISIEKLRHDREVLAMKLLKGDSLLITITKSNEIYFWDTSLKKIIKQFKAFDYKFGSIHRFQYIEDSNRLLIVSTFGKLVIWNIESEPKPVFEAGEEVNPIFGAYWVDSLEQFIVLYSNGTIQRLDNDYTFSPTPLLEVGHPIRSSTINYHRNCLAFAGDKQVYIYSFKDTSLTSWTGLSGQFSSLKLNKSGTQLLSGSNKNHAVFLWSVQDKERLLRTEEYEQQHAFGFRLYGSGYRAWQNRTSSKTKFKFSPDESKILTISGDLQARVWDVTTGDKVDAFYNPDREIIDANWGDNGQFSTIGNDGVLRLWNLETNFQPTTLFSGIDKQINEIVPLQNENRYLLKTWYGKGWILEEEDGKYKFSAIGDSSFQGRGVFHGITSNEIYLVDKRNDKNPKCFIWNSFNSKPIELPFENDDLRCFEISMNGKEALTGWRSGRILKYQLPYFDDSNLIYQSDFPIKYVKYNSNSGSYFALINGKNSDKKDHSVFALLDSNGALIKEDSTDILIGGKNDLIVHEGKLFAYQVWRDTLWKLQFDSKGLEKIFLGSDPRRKGRVRSLKVDKSNEFIVLQSEGELKLFSTNGGLLNDLIGHNSRVVSMHFNEKSTHFITTSWDRSIRIWDIKNGTNIRLEGIRHKIQTIFWDEKNHRILTSDDKGNIHIWKYRWEDLLNHIDTMVNYCLTPSKRVEFLGESLEEAQKAFAKCEKERMVY